MVLLNSNMSKIDVSHSWFVSDFPGAPRIYRKNPPVNPGAYSEGLAIAISLCDSEKHVIFLFFCDFDDVLCFPGLGM